MSSNGLVFGVALVSASGSSIYGMGTPPEDPRGWPITIRTPRDPDAVAATVFLEDMSLSTSGSYEKFFWANGRTYSHIVDPRTGYPAQGTSAVSVVSPRTIDSEAWTKPFFINGRAWSSAHKPAGFRVFFCEDGPQAPCSVAGVSTGSRRGRRHGALIVHSKRIVPKACGAWNVVWPVGRHA